MSTDAPHAPRSGGSLPALTEAIAAIGLVDHHVHGPLSEPVSDADLELLLTESDRPAPPGHTHLDSQVGFAVRAVCAPLLGLPAHAPAPDYLRARAERTPDELARTFMGAARTDRWLVETGYQGDLILDPDRIAGLGVGATDEVVRLESVLESVARGSTAADLPTRFREELARRTTHAVGLKSIIAYRHGFDIDPQRPRDSEVRRAASRWLAQVDAGAPPRVDDPDLLRMALWAGVDTGLPIQLHAGYGDPDVELQRCDPLLLTRWIKAVAQAGTGTRIVLLHCYPFHRNAGYLAQVFPHVFFDVGLAVNYTGAASGRVIAESLELAPFGKILYSSDAWGPPELHHLGATLWRRGTARALAGFVDDGLWSLPDAVRVAEMIGRTNAAHLYDLPERTPTSVPPTPQPTRP